MPINRIVLYAHDVEATVRFYGKHFGFEAWRDAGDRIVELVPGERRHHRSMWCHAWLGRSDCRP